MSANIYVLSKNMTNITIFHLKIVNFYSDKNRICFDVHMCRSASNYANTSIYGANLTLVKISNKA